MPGKQPKFTIVLVITTKLSRAFMSVIFEDHCSEAVMQNEMQQTVWVANATVYKCFISCIDIVI